MPLPNVCDYWPACPPCFDTIRFDTAHLCQRLYAFVFQPSSFLLRLDLIFDELFIRENVNIHDWDICSTSRNSVTVFPPTAIFLLLWVYLRQRRQQQYILFKWQSSSGFWSACTALQIAYFRTSLSRAETEHPFSLRTEMEFYKLLDVGIKEEQFWLPHKVTTHKRRNN